jgi:signal transduction histidine kinase
VLDAQGHTMFEAGVDGGAAEVQKAVDDAQRNQRTARLSGLNPLSADTVLLARPIGTGVQVDGVVVLQASTTGAKADITRVWAYIALGAILALMLVGALALALTRWVVRPLDALSDGVAELTRSLPEPRSDAAPDATIAHRYGGPPEIRDLAHSFDAMAIAVVDSADAQRQLVADTAHKLRNPLAALQIRLDSLAPSIPAAAQSTFERAGSEVERLGSLLDGMLRLAVAESPTRFGRATGSGHDDDCDAALVVHDRIDAWAAAFAAAGIGLEAEGDSAEIAMSADSLSQVLDATLSNACRYAGKGSRTRVSVRRVNSDSTEIAVSDNGVGVSPKDIARLTERFYRGSRGQDGSGLGLSIVKAEAGSHRAKLTITAVEPHGLSVAITVATVADAQ